MSIELGLPDGIKAFVKQRESHYKEGCGVQIVAVKVKQKAKVVVAVDLKTTMGAETVLSSENESLTF